MMKKTCNHCGDTVCVPQRGEMVVSGETPLEHLERTGHAWNQPELRVCEDCEHVWPYKGSADLPTCPCCKGKRTTNAKERSKN